MGCDCEGHGPCACGWTDGYGADGCWPVGAHQAGVEANAWSGEQDLCGEVPAFWMGGVSQREAATEGCHFSTKYYLQEFQCCRREFREWLRFRHVFTAELGEAVIGADEEIVSADMVIVVIRRTMGRNGTGVVVPLQLDAVRQMLPGNYSAVMDLGLVKLGCSTTEHGVGLALVEAFAVTVEERDVANAGPAIFYQCGGMELGHFFRVLFHYKVNTKIIDTTPLYN